MKIHKAFVLLALASLLPLCTVFADIPPRPPAEGYERCLEEVQVCVHNLDKMPELAFLAYIDGKYQVFEENKVIGPSRKIILVIAIRKSDLAKIGLQQLAEVEKRGSFPRRGTRYFIPGVCLGTTAFATPYEYDRPAGAKERIVVTRDFEVAGLADASEPVDNVYLSGAKPKPNKCVVMLLTGAMITKGGKAIKSSIEPSNPPTGLPTTLPSDCTGTNWDVSTEVTFDSPVYRQPFVEQHEYGKK